MDDDMLKRVQEAYEEVAHVCELESPRAKPWAVANDALLLDRVLSSVDPDDVRILDFGCCGWPWVTNFLHREGYDVVGVDITKPHWFEHNVCRELDLALVGYDGERLPFESNSFDITLMFGVLEHVGVWKTSDRKYETRTPETTDHRRRVLGEVERVLSPDGTLYLTKFPNSYGRDKLLAKFLRSDQGHLDSERARPDYLRELVGEFFEIQDLFADGLFPHRFPFAAPGPVLPLSYAKLDTKLSNTFPLSEIAQNYCVVAARRRVQ